MSAENEKGSLKKQESISVNSDREVKHIDNANVNIKLANPLAGLSHEQLMGDASTFAREHGLGHLEEEFRKGALVAQDPTVFESLPQLSEEDKAILRRELTHRWAQPLQLYYLVILCSLSAAVQGVSFRTFSAFIALLIRDVHRWTSRLSTAPTSSSLSSWASRRTRATTNGSSVSLTARLTYVLRIFFARALWSRGNAHCYRSI